MFARSGGRAFGCLTVEVGRSGGGERGGGNDCVSGGNNNDNPETNKDNIKPKK